jgi:hypothetical protein
MSDPDYLIKNCNAKDLEYACPKRWGELKPAFSDMVRHCDHCGKKIYLCETDEQIMFYTSVKFCIAVADPKAELNVERNTPSNPTLVPNATEPVKQHENSDMPGINRTAPNVWRRAQQPERLDAVQYAEMSPSSLKQQDAEDDDIPAFLRKHKK